MSSTKLNRNLGDKLPINKYNKYLIAVTIIRSVFMIAAQELFLKERLNQIVERMKEISGDIETRINQLDADVISTRKDPLIRNLWNKLCLLHMRGLVICESEYDKDKPEICSYIAKPQACVKFLQLTEEETCCNRLLNRVS